MLRARKGSREYKGYRYRDALVRNVQKGDRVSIGGKWVTVSAVKLNGASSKGPTYALTDHNGFTVSRLGINPIKLALERV